MEPTFSKTKKGWGGERKYYKEYHSFRADANRTQQQIKRWNRLKFLNFKSWRSLGQVQSFLINEHSHIYKKIQHGVERICDYTKDTWKIKRNKNIRKRAKNWQRRTKMRNKKKRKLPTLPDNFTGKASTYYFNTHNINLYAYKVRRRFDLSGIPEFNHGYLKAKRCYLNHQKVLLSRQPPIVEDKIIETNEYNQATFFSDKLIMDFHRAHFTPTTPSPQQYTGRTDVIVAKFAWNFSGKLRIILVNWGKLCYNFRIMEVLQFGKFCQNGGIPTEFLIQMLRNFSVNYH
ncbi:unnamed protein product [Rhizophagus irregularis]|nr:unnamed protein product [Rhizophagus irregularis]